MQNRSQTRRPVFPIYTMLMFKWIKKNGARPTSTPSSKEKAKIVCDVLDKSSFYKGHAAEAGSVADEHHVQVSDGRAG